MYISTFLVVSLAVSQALTQSDPKCKDIDGEKDISDINRDLDLSGGDILEIKGIQRNAIVDQAELWTSPVPYVLENSLEMNAKGITLRSFDQFRLKTCLDFKPRDSEQYYLSVQKLTGCFSYIGKAIPNGQPLSIGQFCDDISTVEHEFIHALGFYHEQARYDRDDHVRIIFENIQAGTESNFKKLSAEDSTTLGTPYDYYSVMHYGKNAFSNGNGSTIITTLPEFQEVIGQRLEMSSNDVVKLNRLYNCNGTVAFMEQCSFSDGMCGMSRCTRMDRGWERVSGTAGGPDSDHTNLGSIRPSGSTTPSPQQGAGFFMHSSTASRQEGESAWLESRRMTPGRTCSVQCLQFYYYNSGGDQDQLNIWIREFQDEMDSRGMLRLMGQITGPPTDQWQLHHVPLNATRSFQVEFEVRRGAGNSTGGFSIDDINLSETECPDFTWQIKDFLFRLASSTFTFMYSPRLYSKEGYAYQVATLLRNSYFGMYVRLVSGQYDDQLQWPCPWRQVTFLSLDQNPTMQLQMSKQFSITTDPSETFEGRLVWGNPREVGTNYTDENNEQFFVNTLFGRQYFRDRQDMMTRDFLKGGDAIFLITFQDISPLLQNSSLPCPILPPVTFSELRENRDEGPCSTRFMTTTPRPPTPRTTWPPLTTTDEDNSIFGFSPGMMSSPVPILLALLLLLAH